MQDLGIIILKLQYLIRILVIYMILIIYTSQINIQQLDIIFIKQSQFIIILHIVKIGGILQEQVNIIKELQII